MSKYSFLIGWHSNLDNFLRALSQLFTLYHLTSMDFHPQSRFGSSFTSNIFEYSTINHLGPYMVVRKSSRKKIRVDILRVMNALCTKCYIIRYIGSILHKPQIEGNWSRSFLQRSFIILKEERSGGTVDWPFILCTINVHIR